MSPIGMLEISDNYRVSPQDFGPSQGAIVSASGSHVTKAVTVAEILKKRHSVSDGVRVMRLVLPECLSVESTAGYADQVC